MMNEKQSKLLDLLRESVDRYVKDRAVAERLRASVEPSKVKGVLSELEVNKGMEFSAADGELIREIYFNFC